MSERIQVLIALEELVMAIVVPKIDAAAVDELKRLASTIDRAAIRNCRPGAGERRIGRVSAFQADSRRPRESDRVRAG